MSLTASDVIDGGKQLSDMQNSNFVGEIVWLQWLNDARRELYDILVGRFEDYFITQIDSTTTTDTIALPADFYKLRGIDRDDKTVRSFPFIERNSVDISSATEGYYNRARYCMVGDQIILRPKDNAPATYKIWYIPKPVTIASIGQSFDGMDGWESYLHCDIAIKALLKEESDATGIMSLKQAIKDRIDMIAANRDAGEPQRIADVQRQDIRLSIMGY